ncbi:MAG: hypothetical protein ACOVNL_08225 [Prochlorococcaceae cyanobacterium]|jgi:TRAP-type mannitol/chloroaromatic compound transport system permease large subunit
MPKAAVFAMDGLAMSTLQPPVAPLDIRALPPLSVGRLLQVLAAPLALILRVLGTIQRGHSPPQVSTGSICRGAIPFLALRLLVLLLVPLFPSPVTLLPSLARASG